MKSSNIIIIGMAIYVVVILSAIHIFSTKNLDQINNLKDQLQVTQYQISCLDKKISRQDTMISEIYTFFAPATVDFEEDTVIDSLWNELNKVGE